MIVKKLEDGSNAVINYFSNGSKKYSKERVEVYSQEKTWIVDNFRLYYKPKFINNEKLYSNIPLS